MKATERILEHGAGSVSDAEALSVLLGHRGPEPARQILRDAGGLAGLPATWGSSTVASCKSSGRT